MTSLHAGADVVIAHVVPAGVHPYSGVLTALSHLAIAQTRRGHEVELWLLGPPRAGAENVFAAVADVGVGQVLFPLGRVPGRLSADVARRVTTRRVDVVHLHGVFSPRNNEVAWRLRVPYVVSPHGGYTAEALEHHAFRKRMFAWAFERRLLRGARVICALTRAEMQDIRRFGVDNAVAVIPNGVVVPPSGSVDRESLRATLGLGPETRVAIYVGRFDVHAKRLDDVVQAIAATPAWHLHLVGGDFHGGARRLDQLVRALRLEDRVQIKPPRRGDALRDALACADLFVLMSRSEGMPMALLEAASLGIPSLVSPEVERSTGVSGTGAAWVTAVDQLSVTLQQVASARRDEWTSRSDAALRYARRHNWSRIVAEYDAVYAAARSLASSNDDALPASRGMARPA
jgi:glycosyltransferase involved in cell wall biosynthesis